MGSNEAMTDSWLDWQFSDDYELDINTGIWYPKESEAENV